MLKKYRDGILKLQKTIYAELAEDEFYYHQIIGATVYDETGSELGKIKEIYLRVRMTWVVQRPKKKIYFYHILKALLTKSRCRKSTD